jgi:hypothetical protein
LNLIFLVLIFLIYCFGFWGWPIRIWGGQEVELFLFLGEEGGVGRWGEEGLSLEGRGVEWWG